MNTLMLPGSTAAAPTSPASRRAILAGAAIVGLTIGGLGLWSALAPLSSAAVAPGRVTVESNRKTLQHLEGGIIRELLVKDGQAVTAGQVLLRLDDTRSNATRAGIQQELDGLLARQARLVAEREEADDIAFPAEVLYRQAEPAVAAALEAERTLFRRNRAALADQMAVLQRRIAQAENDLALNEAQAKAYASQLVLIREELTNVADLLAKGYERKPRLLALQRQEAGLNGMREQFQAQAGKVRQQMSELQQQMALARANLHATVAQDLTEVVARIADANQRLRGAADVDRRAEVIAPIGGTVMNLRFFTIGGVVAPGAAILDIVPEQDKLVIEAQIRPLDIDQVHAGMTAEIRLPAYRQRVLPILHGHLTSLSADAVIDERSGGSFYRAKVTIDDEQLQKAAHVGVSLMAGMPAEVMVITGERSLLSYLVQPLTDSFNRAFRDS